MEMSCENDNRLQRLRTLTAAAVVFSFLFLMFAQGVYAEESPSVTLTVSDKTVHSGAPLTLTAELSFPAAADLSISVARQKETLSISIPRGAASGTLSVSAGQYKERSSESFSVTAGEGYSVGDKSKAQVTVLPKPRLTFYAEYYTARPGTKLSVTMKCTNASEMTLPLPVTLRQSDGKILGKFEFNEKKATNTYKYTFPENWEAPFSLRMYNEVTKKKAAQIPVKVADLNRQKGIFSVDTKEKKIAISFDCGFANKYTQYILDTLDEYDIKCTFFVTGVFVSGFPDMLKEIHKRGHEIGNHTANHRSLPKLSDENVLKEVKSVNDAVYKKVGVTPRVMRPPYGSGNFNVHCITRMAGCEVIYWSDDSLDWNPECTEQEIIKRATSKIKNGSIVLFHNSAPKTKQTLRKVLDKYKKMGYKIVPVSELIYHNYFTIDKMGVQKLKSGYKQISPSELMSGYAPVINVSGASEEGQPPVSLPLKADYSDKLQVLSKKNISKIQSDPTLVKVSYDCGDTIAAPVKEGDKIGTATFSYGNDVQFTAELTALADVPVYEKKVEKPFIPSDSDAVQSNATDGWQSDTMAYLIDGMIILCLMVISVILYLKNRKR